VPYSDLPDSLKAEYDRIGREREQASREAERQSRWELLRVCGELLGWTAAGVFVAAIGFATSDRHLGFIYLSAGMVVNYSGVAITLWTAFKRGEERGDW
jgi:hypothetical protein